ncbi:MAG: hypothetical protein KIH08_14450 [Candidatus Freyarchaeota archaeon]|nr:hypothetical protein [Candidatus Jordarchaeia archaeon]MBS7269286.1 hypothetical protein [Candidatus Jordarchaeia archaeon]MBS7280097.1 hypothetical protein [Candidatus Jordarchaeia archaeon]
MKVEVELDDDAVKALKSHAEVLDVSLETVCKFILEEYTRNKGGYVFYGVAPKGGKIFLIQWPYITGQIVLSAEELAKLSR